jgi:hypothetical protein
MHPYHHALSSQRNHGGEVDDYVPLHAWFDLSKSALAHFTHRALRHHREGIAEATRVFGAVITNSATVRVPVQTLGQQHLAEDMSILPSAADWLMHLELPPSLAPTELRSQEDLAAASAARFGLAAEFLLPLHRWFLETSTWFPDTRHLAMRHHSFGIFEAESRFGPLVAGGDNQPAVPTRIVGEWHVRAVLGRVPVVADFLRHLKGQRWMAAAQSPRRLGLA